jgi:hypothetical protein
MTPTALLPDPSPTPSKPLLVALLDRRRTYVKCTAELVECTCPDVCERDHDNE